MMVLYYICSLLFCDLTYCLVYMKLDCIQNWNLKGVKQKGSLDYLLVRRVGM